jgi:hypothetical protein
MSIVDDEPTKVKPMATPGPWHLHAHKPPGTLGTIQVSDSPDHTNKSAVVHWSGFDSGDKPFEVKLANARLIAAAPNLLAACKDLCEWLGAFRDREEQLGNLDMQLVDVARAAIAAAEGRS